jgi:hypothetical protein
MVGGVMPHLMSLRRRHMIRYFDASCEDAYRIAVIEADEDDQVWETNEAKADKEINLHDLPDGFTAWKRYTAHGVGNASVEIMSEDGA